MALTVTTEPMEARQLAMTVVVEPERVQRELLAAARKVSQQYRIPGFRQGKAPYSIVVQYVGAPALYNEFAERLGTEVYREAVEQAKIEPYAVAGLDIETLEPLTYKYMVPLEPIVNLGDYRSLRVEQEVPAVTDEEIDARLEAYRDEYAAMAEVERPSAYGDLLTLDVKSVIVADDASGENAEETVVLNETDWDVTPDQENPMDPPGFDEALLGLRPGEEKEFVLSWPEGSQSIYAGKQARFQVKLHKIQANEKPALDDAFAQLVGPDFPTLDALKDDVRATLLEEKTQAADNAYLEKVLNTLVEQSTMDYPPVVVEDQIDVMVGEFERQLRQYGVDDLDAFLGQMNQTREQYRENLRAQAEIIARQNLVISEIYRLEGITVSDAEIEERITTMVGTPGDENAESANAFAEMMRAGAGRAILESQILRDKALERLLAIVRGDELPPLPAGTQTTETQATEAQTAESADAPAAEAEATTEAEPQPEGEAADAA